MAELLDITWPGLLLVLVVSGVALGLCLRLIALVYPRDDPRRAELIAELYAVPRAERPFWVAEKLEVALSRELPSVYEHKHDPGGRVRRPVASW